MKPSELSGLVPGALDTFTFISHSPGGRNDPTEGSGDGCKVTQLAKLKSVDSSSSGKDSRPVLSMLLTPSQLVTVTLTCAEKVNYTLDFKDSMKKCKNKFDINYTLKYVGDIK